MNPSTQDTQPTNQAYKSLLYWRKSLWNSARCVPVILTLQDEQLSMTSSDMSIIFQAPQSDVTAKFTGWGTMVLSVAGQSYDMVGMPASVSPAVSESQKQDLALVRDNGGQAGQGTDMQLVVLGSAATNAAGGAPGDMAGTAAMAAVYYRGLAGIRQWQTLLAGPNVKRRKMNNMTIFFIAIAAVLVGMSIIALVM